MAVSRRGFLGRVAAGAAAGTTAGVTLAEPATAAAAQPAVTLRGMRTDKEWERFLAGQDLLWKRMPRTWYEGPFLGNGLFGSIVYQEPGENALRFTVHHSESQDHRPTEGGSDWGVARLPVGNLLLRPVGAITGVDLRLDLWNAEVRGTITTDKGTLKLRALVHNDRTMLLATVEASEGEEGFRWEYRPSPAISPRIVREDPPKGFEPNPAPVSRTEDGMGITVQSLVPGGQTASAYKERGKGRERTYYLAVAHSFPGTDAEGRVRTTVRKASALPVSSLLRSHCDWWHRFYRKSFISVPDGMLQSFYWIQLYKLACAAREHAPVMATTGPWVEPTPWPGVWWNLNVQLEYWPVYGSNHLELDAIPRTLTENTDVLIKALKPEYQADSAGLRRSTDAQCEDNGSMPVPGVGDPEVGNLPWALHNVWLTYRHSMDRGLLEDVLYPLLRRSTNYYLHFLQEQSDGKLHLPKTFSPEYGSAPDCNYDLALLRWSCKTLLETVELLDKDDELAPKWREVLDKLVDYPVDENGFMIGTGVPFAKSHRHYSHMLSVYPLYLVNWDQKESRDLIERSLEHWISFEGALRGYSFSGAASISTQMGRGDDALKYLRELVARFIQPNTHYYEAGPVIETPLSGAQSIHDMLCQSWGDTIRFFPGVPGEWRDVALHDFRTQGAFLVSGVRKGGTTRWVRVRSLAGEPCKVRHSIAGRVTVAGVGGPAPKWREVADGVIELELDRDEEAVVYPAGSRPDFEIAPVKVTKPAERWGLPALPETGAATQVDLVGHFDNDAITTEMYYGDGDFDGTGRTYPMAQLPQTGQTEDDGITFSFTNGSEGSNNNVIAAGQKISVPAGSYAKLHVLGSGDTADVTVPAELGYADGSTAKANIQLTAWLSGPKYGETEAVRTSQIHTRTGALGTKAAIFHQKLELDPAKELSTVTLGAPSGTARAHIFALTLEKSG
ncbi:glycosyl hydrolase family 95 catalytic domain-containing protein [Streptomyces milbemycinicus]|uniref:glycosyl hydrolase family 95 catalytic domain-containing protein n=1 Tax=Streptomyces milbemycinicus TaxID=476552 RepID=UPI0034094BB2